MPVNFIPNQPVIFEKGYPNQPCLNVDNKAYAQLVQRDDVTCFQVRLDPCADELICDPDMYTEGVNIIESHTGAWEETVGTAWDRRPTDLLYTGTEETEANVTDKYATCPGAVYRVTFNVLIFGTPSEATLRVFLNTASQSFLITESGTYTLYFVAQTNASELGFRGIGQGFIQIFVQPPNPFELTQVTNCCWKALTGTGEDPNLWSYSYENGQGRFCSTPEQPVTSASVLQNTSAFVNDNQYHSVTFTISNWISGSVEVIMGTVSFGIVSGNGTFTVYGIPSVADGLLEFRPDDDFIGCISEVDVLEFTTPSLRLTSGFASIGSPVVATLVEDRAIWCITWNDSYFSAALSCQQYTLEIFEQCGEIDNQWRSLTVFSYSPDDIPCTFMLVGKNNGEAFGLLFTNQAGTEVYSLRLRLRVLSFNPVYPAKGEDYLSSNGQLLRPYTETAKQKEMLFDRVDELTHDCIRLILLSDESELSDNNNTYQVHFPVQDYEPEWGERGRYNLAQSRADIIFKNEPSRFNRSC